VASLEVAARHNGFTPKRRHEVVQASARSYREAMRRFAGMRTLEIWYSRIDADVVTQLLRADAKSGRAEQFERTVAKARRKDSSRAFEKLATSVNGDARILADPPLIVPVADMLPGAEADELEARMRGLLRAYRSSLSADRCKLLDQYRFADMARKVVGVGSVGTRAWVILMLGRDAGDPLFIQAKEAQRSVLEPFVGKSEFDNQGRRVVEGQRLMQAASDIFLGWLRTTGLDERRRDFYLRQLWDWKASADLSRMTEHGLRTYTRACAWSLARSHARSGDRLAIAAYLGKGRSFDRAIARFSALYADQNELDHRRLRSAVRSGEIEAREGI
jgi:uncharacterized protein (DUF2252 family)